MSEISEKETKKIIKDLVLRVFKKDGEDGLRWLEELFAERIRDVRGSGSGAEFTKVLDEGPLYRERYAEIIGESPAIHSVFRLIDRISDAIVPVLIQGDSGTGKELVASAIHRVSPRSDMPFVAENCAAIPETLLESELFGYKKGAFTGAVSNKSGLFKVADRGTLFLDEIGDMSLSMQKKLLRVLQDGEVRPVGSSEMFHVDVRLISASNKNLKRMVSKGLFREDLFFRLNTITIYLPPLRDRAEDIPLLVEFFARKVGEELGRESVPFTAEALAAMKNYSWPGNIRELENEIRRCMALKGDDQEIGLDALSDTFRE